MLASKKLGIDNATRNLEKEKEGKVVKSVKVLIRL